MIYTDQQLKRCRGNTQRLLLEMAFVNNTAATRVTYYVMTGVSGDNNARLSFFMWVDLLSSWTRSFLLMNY